MIKPNNVKDFKEDTYELHTSDEELTKISMELSNSALAEDWEEEDNDYWTSLSEN